jgi:Tol biopolymer transport system component
MNTMKLRLVAVALSAAMIAPAGAQHSDGGRAMLEAAKQKETLEGDLPAAIRQYQAIVDKYRRTDRAVVADALVAMAACYQKQGDAQAKRILQMVLRDYAEQKGAVALARARLGPTVSATRAGMVNVQAWRGPKVNNTGSVSRDGRYLSYVDLDSGDLALHDLVADTDRHLTHNPLVDDGTGRSKYADFAQESTFSPDGTQVAYSWWNTATRRFELRILKLSARAEAEPRVLFDQPDVAWIGTFDWSNDGVWLAVAIERQGNTGQLGVINTADGSLRILKSATGKVFPVKMFFSPDSVFIADDASPGAPANQPRDVFVRAVAGGEEMAVVAHAANDRLMGWAPDGRSLLFSSDRAGSMAIWSLPVAKGKPQGEPLLLKDMGSLRLSSLGVTRSGALLYAARPGPQIEVAVVDFETGKLLAAPKTLRENDSYDSRAADWSPDGAWIAYIEERPGARAKLVLESLETHAKRTFEPPIQGFERPRWTPDGGIILQGGDAQGRQGLFRLDGQTGAVTPIVVPTDATGAFQASVSPDGKRIVYCRQGARETTVVERDLASGSERELVRRERVDVLSLSPDGLLFTFIERDPAADTSVLRVMATEGGPARELFRMGPGRRPLEQGRLGYLTEWTPDGRRILFAKIQDAVSTWIIPASGGAPVEVAHERALRAARIHRDGRRVAFQAGNGGPSEVWSLENFQSAPSTAKK